MKVHFTLCAFPLNNNKKTCCAAASYSLMNAVQRQRVFLVGSGAGEVGDSTLLMSVQWFLADTQSKETAVLRAGNYSAHSSILTGVCVCVCVCVCV